MTGGPESGHSVTEKQQQIIDVQMAEESSQQMSSLNRERWHNEFGDKAVNLLKEVSKLSFVQSRGGDIIEISGLMNGHQIKATLDPVIGKENRGGVECLVDGSPLPWDDAYRAYNHLMNARDMILQQNQWIERIEKENKESKNQNIMYDVFMVPDEEKADKMEEETEVVKE